MFSRLAVTILSLTVFLVGASGCSGTRPDARLALIYDQGWTGGVSYGVCVIAGGGLECDDRRNDPAELAGDTESRDAFRRGLNDGFDRAKKCIEVALASFDSDLPDLAKVEGTVDLERAATLMNTYGGFEEHADCVSEEPGNPYEG